MHRVTICHHHAVLIDTAQVFRVRVNLGLFGSYDTKRLSFSSTNDELDSEDEQEKTGGTVGTHGMKDHPFLFLHHNGSLCNHRSFASRSRSRPVKALQARPSVPSHHPARAGPRGEVILSPGVQRVAIPPAGGSHILKALDTDNRACCW